MRAPLHSQAAVFAALLALSTCLTGKEMLLGSFTYTQAGAVTFPGTERTSNRTNTHIAHNVTVAA